MSKVLSEEDGDTIWNDPVDNEEIMTSDKALVEIHFNENSIPGIIAGPLTEKSKRHLLSDLLELIGEDEDTSYLDQYAPEKEAIEVGNGVRAELRTAIERYFK